MKGRPRIGAVGQVKFAVEAQHAIDFAVDGMPAVLSTPWLVWFLEHAAREAVLPHLEPGESTVGLEIEVRHVAPTPLGHQVTCLARVIHVEGARITFQVEARDETELIARGVHRLHVIRVAGFARRVAQKSGLPAIGVSTGFSAAVAPGGSGAGRLPPTGAGRPRPDSAS